MNVSYGLYRSIAFRSSLIILRASASETSFIGVAQLTITCANAAPAKEGIIGLPKYSEREVIENITNDITEPLIKAAIAPCQVALFQKRPNMAVTQMPDIKVEIIFDIYPRISSEKIPNENARNILKNIAHREYRTILSL